MTANKLPINCHNQDQGHCFYELGSFRIVKRNANTMLKIPSKNNSLKVRANIYAYIYIYIYIHVYIYEYIYILHADIEVQAK